MKKASKRKREIERLRETVTQIEKDKILENTRRAMRKHHTLFQTRNEEKVKKHLSEKLLLPNKKEASKRARD